MAGSTVLVVEDEPRIVEFLVENLRGRWLSQQRRFPARRTTPGPHQDSASVVHQDVRIGVQGQLAAAVPD
ncbi:MAG TPA: hypothetical protein VGN92_08685, partial [Mycobacterium sp.]|nr:hypothetical protein [Mycobacterium sp.]